MAKVLFIQDLAYEYFGTMHISAMLKRHGHQCDVIIENMEHNLVQTALQLKPDLIAFSCLTPTVAWALKLSRELKAVSRIPIIFGGSHVTLNPESIAEHDVVDYICVGEGEFPMVELCNAMDRGEFPEAIRNLWIRQDGKIIKNPLRPLNQQLDELPFADRELYAKYHFFSLRKVKAMLLGRGCPYKCNYCHNHAKMILYKGLGKYSRIRSPQHVLAEIDQMLERYDVECLHFIDDAFGNHKKWLREFLPEFAKRKVRFIGALRANCIDDETAGLFKQYGLNYLSFAVETGDEEFRNAFLKKQITDDQLMRASRILRIHKIPFLTMNMVGLPDETLEQTFQTLELNIALRPVYACCYIYQPYPNTELYNYLVSKGLLDPEAEKHMGFLSYDVSLLKQKDIAVQKNIQRLFALTVMFPSLLPVVKRVVKFRSNVLFDGIFYSLYAYYLWRYFRLTPKMILYNIKFWITYQYLKKTKSA